MSSNNLMNTGIPAVSAAGAGMAAMTDFVFQLLLVFVIGVTVPSVKLTKLSVDRDLSRGVELPDFRGDFVKIGVKMLPEGLFRLTTEANTEEKCNFPKTKIAGLTWGQMQNQLGVLIERINQLQDGDEGISAVLVFDGAGASWDDALVCYRELFLTYSPTSGDKWVTP